MKRNLKLNLFIFAMSLILFAALNTGEIIETVQAAVLQSMSI